MFIYDKDYFGRWASTVYDYDRDYGYVHEKDQEETSSKRL
jgi:hypothetical protein